MLSNISDSDQGFRECFGEPFDQRSGSWLERLFDRREVIPAAS